MCSGSGAYPSTAQADSFYQFYDSNGVNLSELHLLDLIVEGMGRRYQDPFNVKS